MSRLLEKLSRFMYGRYGSDSLNKALFWVYLAVVVVNLFFRSYILSVLAMVVGGLFIFRALSKNIYKRSAENRKYCEIKDKITAFFNRTFKRSSDIFERDREHVFRKCKQCGAKLRLPRKKGNHVVRCPRCGKLFNVHIFM